ncbi:MAG: response regulator [Kofleriaceae bacterium]|nr:MAG: response regulator [Kofleriaceae bacterium]MBZ0235686.1 response regulator [Kofleriaceae bacterium]
MGRPGRILVAEDDALSRASLAELLASEGYRVATAVDGIEALGKLADFAPDVLLTDLWMPRLNGIDLITRARAAVPSLEVLVMTACVQDVVDEALQQGAFGYVRKPIHFGQLTMFIAGALERRQTRLNARG